MYSNLRSGLCFGFMVCFSGCNDEAKVPPAAFHNQPLTLAISFQGGMLPGYSISMNSAGTAEVTCGFHQVNPIREEVTLSDAELLDLRMTLKKESIFNIPPVIGNPVPDGSTISLTVVLGQHSHTVTGHLSSRSAQDMRNDESRRFLLICNAIIVATKGQTQNAELKQMLSRVGPVGPQDSSN